MRVLIAEDDHVSRYLLQATLAKWGYEVVVAEDGLQALEIILSEDSPQLIILDWMMPGVDGLQVCQKARQSQFAKFRYIILLTAKGEKSDIVAGLEAGADDYVTKPFVREELQARVKVGLRLIEVQNNLATRVAELQAALSQVKQLQGILPMCAHCKKIRNDQDYWQQLDTYISNRVDVQVSHSICPDCFDVTIKQGFEDLKQKELILT